jgi:protein-tyrosine phosphatase
VPETRAENVGAQRHKRDIQFYEDGSNPTQELVRRFILMADKVITQGGKVAVHCKAGLGRTGVL